MEFVNEKRMVLNAYNIIRAVFEPSVHTVGNSKKLSLAIREELRKILNRNPHVDDLKEYDEVRTKMAMQLQDLQKMYQDLNNAYEKLKGYQQLYFNPPIQGN